MRRRLKNLLRSIRYTGRYPILLPHFEIVANGLQPIYGPLRALDASMLDALRLCDGTRTLGAIARAARVSRAQLLQQHEDGSLLLWRSPIPPTDARSPDQAPVIIVSPHPDDAALSLGGVMLGFSGPVFCNLL